MKHSLKCSLVLTYLCFVVLSSAHNLFETVAIKADDNLELNEQDEQTITFLRPSLPIQSSLGTDIDEKTDATDVKELIESHKKVIDYVKKGFQWV